MISQTAEYALRAIVHMAKKPDEPHITRDIAEATRVPSNYLSKVMQTLVKARLIRSRRGQRGGFRLDKSPKAISILDVVTAVDPIQRIQSCPLGLPEHSDNLCPLHRQLDQALAGIETALGSTSIADIAIDPDAQEECQVYTFHSG